MSSKEVRSTSASEHLVLVASVQGIIVTDHDIEVAATFRVPWLAVGVDDAISVNDTDIKALLTSAIWCLCILDSIYRAYCPSISAEHGLISPLISD